MDIIGLEYNFFIPQWCPNVPIFPHEKLSMFLEFFMLYVWKEWKVLENVASVGLQLLFALWRILSFNCFQLDLCSGVFFQGHWFVICFIMN